MTLEEKFNEILGDKKLIDSLKRKIEFDEFKEQYKVERASPLKCPACSQWGQTGGSLWIVKGTENKFVCRRCRLEWQVDCLTKPNAQLIKELRESLKEPKNESKD